MFRTQSSSAARRIRKPILLYSQKFLLSLKTLSSLCSQESCVLNKHWHVHLCEMAEWHCRLINGSGVFHIQLKSRFEPDLCQWCLEPAAAGRLLCSVSHSSITLSPGRQIYTLFWGALHSQDNTGGMDCDTPSIAKF